MEPKLTFKEREIKKPVRIKANLVSERAKLAVMYKVEDGGISKRKALLKAGYSQAVADNPARVFNSPAVADLLDKAGVNARTVVSRVYKKMWKRSLRKFNFPRYTADVEVDEDGKPDRETSSLTEGDIIAILEAGGFKVLNIEHKNNSRVVWCSEDNTQVQGEAESKMLDLLGIRAPRRIEGDIKVENVFSLSGLRTQMEANNFEVIVPRVIDIE